MAFRWLLAVNVIALVFLVLSLFLTLALKNLMGKGKDTGPVKILMIVIILNVALGAVLLVGGWFQYINEWVTYARITDIALMLIGVILTGSVAKVYVDYKNLIKKHEPGE